MGNYTRKATFTVEGTGAKRIFTAVNKRAHTVCKKTGKRSKITVDELKELKGSGSYKYYHYTEDGSLKPIRL